MMGFDDVGKWRSPNLLVKHCMMKTLGWTYDEQEEIKHRPYLYQQDENPTWTADDS